MLTVDRDVVSLVSCLVFSFGLRHLWISPAGIWSMVHRSEAEEGGGEVWTGDQNFTIKNIKQNNDMYSLFMIAITLFIIGITLLHIYF